MLDLEVQTHHHVQVLSNGENIDLADNLSLILRACNHSLPRGGRLTKAIGKGS